MQVVNARPNRLGKCRNCGARNKQKICVVRKGYTTKNGGHRCYTFTSKKSVIRASHQ